MRDAYEKSNHSTQMAFVLGSILRKLEHEDEGRRLLEEAASRGFGAALLKLGEISYYSGHYPDAAKYWKGARDAGMGEATFVLAKLYQDGMGVQKDMQRAEELFRKSMSEGYCEACSNLALILAKKGSHEVLDVLEKGIDLDSTVCYLQAAHLLSRQFGDEKKQKRVKIAHARHDPRAEKVMKRQQLSPLRVPGPQVADTDPMSVNACAACLAKISDLNQCSLCKEVCYCGRQCQQADWRAKHSRLCTGR